MDRRDALRLGLGLTAGVVGAALTGCARDAGQRTTPTERSTTTMGTSTPSTGSPRVLLAYFSRAGENYYYGGRTQLKVGNTEVLATMIADITTCDLHRIEAADPYPESYDETVARNVREQDSDARPAIDGDLPSLDGYDVVILGSGLWNVRPPMIMSTFAEALDFSGVTVHPLVTYAVSRMGNAESVYRQACEGAKLGEGLAVLGEEVADARPEVERWLRRIGLTIS